MDLTNWTKAHFCAYIFFCIADADDDMNKNEVSRIENFLEHLHFDHENAFEILSDVRLIHKRHSTDLRVNFITTKSTLFLDPQEISNVIEEIEHLILADNDIKKSEIRMYGKIRRALGVDEND